MSQTSLERLGEYLAQLPPNSQALLMREFERAIARGEDVAVATFVLEQLRKIVRAPSEDVTPRTADPMRLAFQPLEPFLVEHSSLVRPGQIRRASLPPIWLWLSRDGIPEQVAAFEAALHGQGADVEGAVRKIQSGVTNVISELSSPEGSRTLARLGSPSVIEDIGSVGAVLKTREALVGLDTRLPSYMREMAQSQIRSITSTLSQPSLQSPQALPFALSMVMQRLEAPWQVVRLGVAVAESDDEIRIAGTPFGVTISMAIQDLARLASDLRTDIKRGQLKNIDDKLKTLHDGMRGLRTEIDFRTESVWGKQLASIRADISNGLKSDIDSVPGRVRRLLRQGPDKDVTANSRLDATEVAETVALIDFVAICRNYAGELAINEVTLRSFNELQQYVETATETLVESMRAQDPKVLAYRRQQVDAAIRFCDILFGADYATTMRKAAEVARTAERKPARTG